MRYAQLQDEVLTCIMAQCRNHCPLDVVIGYHELKSFDALIMAIAQAEEQGLSLHQVIQMIRG